MDWRNGLSPDNSYCIIDGLNEEETKGKLLLSMPREMLAEKVERLYLISHAPGIDHVPREAVSMFPKLRRLQIQSKISNIFAEDFSNSAKNSDLIEIDLSKNKITIIKRSTFVWVPLLEVPDLSENEISTIEKDAFNGLSKLKTLNLYSNEIKVVNDNMFDGLVELSRLHLGGNGIEKIGSSLYMLNSIEEIFLGANKINDTDFEKLAILPRLKKLDLFYAAVNLTNSIDRITVTESDESPLQRLAVGILTSLHIKEKEPTETVSVVSPLEVLDVAMNDLTLEAALKIVRICPNLTRINVGGSLFKHEFGVVQQMQEIRTSLWVEFSGNHMIKWNED